MLVDQLSNVGMGKSTSNQRLVLQLIDGLNESYEGITMPIQQTTPLLYLYEGDAPKRFPKFDKKFHAAINTNTWQA